MFNTMLCLASVCLFSSIHRPHLTFFSSAPHSYTPTEKIFYTVPCLHTALTYKKNLGTASTCFLWERLTNVQLQICTVHVRLRHTTLQRTTLYIIRQQIHSIHSDSAIMHIMNIPDTPRAVLVLGKAPAVCPPPAGLAEVINPTLVREPT